MDNDDLLREELKKKFHGKTKVTSKYIPKLPVSAEREYMRMANTLAAEIIKPVLKERLPELALLLRSIDASVPATKMDAKGKISKQNAGKRTEARLNAMTEMSSKLDDWFNALLEAITANLRLFNLKSKLDEIGSLTEKLSIREWKKTVHKTLGINIFDDYYKGGIYGELLAKWIEENTNLISALPDDMIKRMKKTVMKNYINGVPVSQIAKEIEREYGVTKRHARLLARDQTAKLNSNVTKYKQQSCGVKSYEWSTSLDQRVRDDHRALEGKIFSWDKPPEIGNTGRRCHPGEDYQCRCVALPVFDLDTLDVAVDPSEEEL